MKYYNYRPLKKHRTKEDHDVRKKKEKMTLEECARVVVHITESQLC